MSRARGYLGDADNLAVGFLQLPQLAHEVPVTGLGRNVLRCEYRHAVQRGTGVLL